MIAPASQQNVGAHTTGDGPQTPYDGLQRTWRSLDGDGTFRPCAAHGKPTPKRTLPKPRKS